MNLLLTGDWKAACLLISMAQKLLLIDENSQLLTLVGDYLSNLGYEVHRARESDEAEALLKNYRFSIVITGTEWENFGNSGNTLTQSISSLEDCPRIIRMEEPHSTSCATLAQSEDAITVIEKPTSLLRLGDLCMKF
jgi:DNA-binding NtrC family response regulator